ncbi:hypothetical protein [Chromatocurvus halotolerans]|uniref:Lipoprotein n=1 Tax=Chromatocurvus halotolerans TaxID=1132028 RepID=A0A4R2KLV2_9GAMM|nr:hypothetical protein [Chromatocurvus halotolerans]TCO74663.1 hypothetical protein EV688_11222 [Chromatocurvus halotolerans]
MTRVRAVSALLILLASAVLAGCVSQTVKSTSVPPLQRPAEPIAEAELLDVGIAIFDPGLEEYDEEDQVYPEVRRAEARFMPQLLAEAMQQSGAWGAVRVLPDNDRITDLRIDGEIIHSDGERVELAILATDSQGNTWLDNTYSARTSRYAYRSATRRQYDPFQALYHRIANDLMQKQAGMSSKSLQTVRTITELRFARDFASGSFEGYLEQNRNGKYRIARLPAEGDPMLERVRAIRKRDHLFVDTLQEYYRDFSGAMYEPYQEWRKMSYEEAVALQELRAQSRRQLIAGGAAILAGIAASGSNDRSARTAGYVAMMGGGSLLKSGLETRNEAQIHVQALEELGMSLEAEITPRVIELDDRTVMLSGNVEDQYNQWREILEEIYRNEVGNLDAAASDGSAIDSRS